MPRKKKAKKTSTRVTVSKAALDKLVHLGASHHATVQSLKKSVRVVRKKASKKTAKRRKTRR